MCGKTKFALVSLGYLSVLIALVTLSCAQKPAKPTTIPPHEEAMYIALGTKEEDLLPNPDLVAKIVKGIVQIRKDNGYVRNVTNPGNWHLGRVRVSNYSPDLKSKIDKSEYGPVTEVKVSKTNKKEADLFFSKPYHPIRLSQRLKKEFGAEAQEIWYDPKKKPRAQEITHQLSPEDKFEFVNGKATYWFSENNGTYIVTGSMGDED